MHIGILQCGHAKPDIVTAHGDYDAMFRRLLAGRGWRFTTWNVVDMEFPEGPHEADAWLITGSRHGAYEPLPFIAPLEAFIRKAAAAEAPILGICFGHQIVAQALGGTVVKYPEGWAIGRTDYAIDGLGTVALTAWHQDQVTALPPGARNLGASDFCANAALAYGETILTIQPHPEFDAAVSADYFHNRRHDPEYPPGMIDAAAARAGQPLDGPRVADWFADFLTHAHGRAHDGREAAHG